MPLWWWGGVGWGLVGVGVGGWWVYFNLCDPFVNIKQFVFLDQWNGCIFYYGIVLFGITMLQ